MIKEELEKEVEEWLDKRYLKDMGVRTPCKQAYLASAELREKRIEKLELKLKALEGQTPWKDIKDKSELIKENAELKADNDARKFAMVMSEKVEKQLREENAELKSRDCWKGCLYASGKSELIHEFLQQKYNLTKAKKIIKSLLDCLRQDTNDPQTNYYVGLYMTKAEQFLNEVEK